MSAIPPEYKSVGMTLWQWNWAIDNKQILLQDLTDQSVVDRYASHDKWVNKHISIGDGTFHMGSIHAARTQALASVSPSDFYLQNGRMGTGKRGMWNEPVLFMRFMKVNDPGGKMIPLKSVDGRTLKVVHMQDDKYAYKSNLQMSWIMGFSGTAAENTYLDNKQKPVAPIPGLDM